MSVSLANVTKRALLGLGLCAAAAAAWGARTIWILENELDAHLRIISAVNAQMGFSYGTPYENGVEVFVITDVAPEGLMDVAGFKGGDYPDCSIASLYERIVFGQGREVDIPVERAGQRHVVSVRVPQLILPDDPSELHWYVTKHHE